MQFMLGKESFFHNLVGIESEVAIVYDVGSLFLLSVRILLYLFITLNAAKRL